MKIYSLILAGGSGERLGGIRKTDLRVGGTKLLDRVARRFSALETPLLVSLAQGQSVSLGNAIALPDALPNRTGPIAGVLAAVAHLTKDSNPDSILVTVAVDTPFLPEDYVSRLSAPVAKGANAAISVWRHTDYPTNAAYNLLTLRRFLSDTGPDSVPNSPKRLLNLLHAVQIDWSATCAQNPFANLNTLEDLISLGSRANAAPK